MLRGALVALAIGSVLWFLGRQVAGSIALVLGSLLVVASATASESALVSFHRLGLRAGLLVGRALTFLLLTPVYGLVFVPFGWLFRRGRRDVIGRRFLPSAPTYWTTRAEQPGSTEHPF